ncbi:type II citrate synthase, partial [Vibrio parahaemolyticus]
MLPPFATLEDLSIKPLDESEEYQGNPRLGFLYQHLCTAALANSEQYEIIAEEIQLNDSDGKTI